MGLELNFTSNTYSSDGKKLIVVDVTGDYAADNTGGYGTPNPTRASQALLPIFYDQGTDVSVAVDDYDPVTATQFTIPFTKDGVIYGRVYAVPQFANEASVTGAVVGKHYWLTDTDTLVKCTATSSNVFEGVTFDELFLEEGETYATANAYFTAYGERFLYEQIFLRIANEKSAREKNSKEYLTNLYDKQEELTVEIQALKVKFDQGEYNNAQIIVEAINDFVDSVTLDP